MSEIPGIGEIVALVNTRGCVSDVVLGVVVEREVVEGQIGELRVLREDEFDGVGSGDLAGEVIEEGLTIGESDGGDPLCAGVLDVLGVLDVVVLDVMK